MSDTKELLDANLYHLIRDMLQDSEYQDFYPLLKEILIGIEIPEYDNINLVLDLFVQNNMDYICKKIAEAAYHSQVSVPSKKWYD